jgi:hypothetical protein
METRDNREGQGHEVAGAKTRRVGLRHLGLGFLALVLLLLLMSWCSLPVRGTAW